MPFQFTWRGRADQEKRQSSRPVEKTHAVAATESTSFGHCHMGKVDLVYSRIVTRFPGSNIATIPSYSRDASEQNGKVILCEILSEARRWIPAVDATGADGVAAQTDRPGRSVAGGGWQAGRCAMAAARNMT
jgi:hypothetical protein